MIWCCGHDCFVSADLQASFVTKAPREGSSLRISDLLFCKRRYSENTTAHLSTAVPLHAWAAPTSYTGYSYLHPMAQHNGTFLPILATLRVIMPT
jgi:hypothetical protein